MELHPAETTVICTDSLSVHAVLKKDNWRDCQDWTREIIIQRRRVKGFVTILWVPSHYGVDGIEKADILAEKGPVQPCTLGAIPPVIIKPTPPFALSA